MHDLLFDQIISVLLLKSDCENQGIYVATNNEMMELIEKLPMRGIRSLYFLWENFKSFWMSLGRHRPILCIVSLILYTRISNSLGFVIYSLHVMLSPLYESFLEFKFITLKLLFQIISTDIKNPQFCTVTTSESTEHMKFFVFSSCLYKRPQISYQKEFISRIHQ